MESIHVSVGQLNDKVVTLQKENVNSKIYLAYLQSQSMRNNLIVTGIQEEASETKKLLEATLRIFIHEKMKVANDLVEQMKFDRVHMMGSKDL